MYIVFRRVYIYIYLHSVSCTAYDHQAIDVNYLAINYNGLS